MTRFLSRILMLIAVLLGTSVAASAQVTVTGHILNPDGTPAKNAKACMSLQNFKPQSPRVLATGTLVQTSTFCVTASSVDGSFSTSLFPNFAISPAQTFWRVDYVIGGVQQSSATYNITTSPFNLDSAAPTVTFPPPNGFVNGAKQFEFTQGIPSTTWTIRHAFGDKNVVFNCYDPISKFLIPDTVVETDLNTLTITFSSPQAGSCVVMNAGNVGVTTTAANAVVTNPNSTQVVSGAPLTIQSPFNAASGGGLVGTFTGPTALTNPNATLFAAGMRCDGATDDSAALAATLSLAAPGTRVAIPLGTCLVKSNISLPDGVWLQGTGAATSTLRQASGTNDATNPLIKVSGTTGNVTISDLTIDGNKAGQSSGNCLIGNSQSGDMQGFKLTNSTLMNAWQGAVCFLVPAGHLIRDFDISDNTFSSNSTATTQLQDQSGGWADISIRAPFGGRIHHNNSINAQSNFVIFGTNAVNPVGHVVIDHNVVTGSLGFGVALGGGGGFGTDDVIDGNYFNMPNARENVIDVANWNNNLVANNVIYWGTCTFCSGIGDGPPSSATNIQGNTLVANFNQVTPGLCIGNGGNTNISNNFCYGGGIGIQLAANTVVDGAVVEGNTVINARTGNPGLQTLLSGGSSLSNVIIKGNHFYDNQTPHTQTYGIEIGAQGATTGYSNFTIEGNDVRNNLTGGIHIATPSMPSGFVIRGNPGYDPMSDNPYDIIASGNISQTTIFTTPAIDSFAYTVLVSGGITTPATSSSTAPSINITYTDADSLSARTVTVTPAAPTGNTRATSYNTSVPIYAAAGTVIGVNSSGYASSGATGMQYSIHIRLRREN